MCKKIRVAVLVENTSDGVFAAEHGLSLYIEYDGKKILLDAGQSDAFCANADAMGISLTNLDAYVLSHGHYDHSGGFEQIFLRDPNAKIYAQSGALDAYFSFRRRYARDKRAEKCCGIPGKIY